MSMNREISSSELAADIHQEITQAQNWSGSEWREAMRRALDYLLYRDKGDEVSGRSAAQSGDVADMLDNIQAELQPMYDVDTLFEFLSEGPQDDQNAETETKAVNWYWTNRLRGFTLMDDAVQDALLLRLGFIKVWYEESDGLPYEETLSGDAQQISAEIEKLSQGAKTRPLEVTETQASQTTIVQGIGPDGLTPVLQEIEVAPSLYEVTILVVPQHKEVKGACPAPEDMFISDDATGTNMQQPRFVAQRRRMAKQAVVALGFDPDQVERLPEISQPWESDIKQARSSDYNAYQRNAPTDGGDQVDLFECYYLVDQDGDGVTELRKVFWGGLGTEIMRWADGEEANEIVRVRPFACGQALKVAHRQQGRSPAFDKMEHIEDISRTLYRQMLDNVYQANDQKTIVGAGVNMEDLEDTDVGGFIRSPTSVDNVKPYPYQPIVGESLQALTYMRRKRQDAAGGSIEGAREGMPVANAAHTTERVMSSLEQLVGMYARNLAESMVRDIAVLLHQQMTLLPGKVQFEDGNTWRETEPRYWIERERVNVRLGDGAGQKMRKLAALERVVEAQAADSEKYMGVLVDLDGMYQARRDYAAYAGLDDPEQYFVDPKSPQAQQVQQQRQQQAQQAQQQAEQDRQLAVAERKAVIDAQVQMQAMQEQTDRMANQMKAMNDEKDRMAEMMQKMTELALKFGINLPYSATNSPRRPLDVINGGQL